MKVYINTYSSVVLITETVQKSKQHIASLPDCYKGKTPQTHQELPCEDIQLHLCAGHTKHCIALQLTTAIPGRYKRQLHTMFLNLQPICKAGF